MSSVGVHVIAAHLARRLVQDIIPEVFPEPIFAFANRSPTGETRWVWVSLVKSDDKASSIRYEIEFFKADEGQNPIKHKKGWRIVVSKTEFDSFEYKDMDEADVWWLNHVCSDIRNKLLSLKEFIGST